MADDLPVCTQKAWPVDPIDKLVRKVRCGPVGPVFFLCASLRIFATPMLGDYGFRKSANVGVGENSQNSTYENKGPCS